MNAPQFITLHDQGAQALRDQALAGLQASTAQVSPKFFYDALGSRLFDAITETEEYYPTRTEAQLQATMGAEIARRVLEITGPGPTLIDLGAGTAPRRRAGFPCCSRATTWRWTSRWTFCASPWPACNASTRPCA